RASGHALGNISSVAVSNGLRDDMAMRRRANCLRLFAVVAGSLVLVSCGDMDAQVERMARTEAALEIGMPKKRVLEIAGAPSGVLGGDGVDGPCREDGGKELMVSDQKARLGWGLLGTHRLRFRSVCINRADTVVSVERIVF